MTSPARTVSVAGQCMLIVLGLAWAWLERPAPVINVRWNDGLSEDARRRNEAQLELHSGQPSNESMQYELWSPGTAGVSAVVGHPDVVDTGHVDRGSSTIGADAGRGKVRVWWAGPFTGGQGRALFRWVFALVGIATIAATRRAGRELT